MANFIANTTTRKGLKVNAQIDFNEYPKGVKIPKKVFDALPIKGMDINPKGFYTIFPIPIQV